MTRPRLLILLAFLAFISLGLPDTLLGVAWPSIQHAFAQPISSLGALAAFGTAGYFTSSFFAGSVMNRLGVGWLLVGSSALVTTALAGYVVSPIWYGLFASAFIAGLGAGAIDAGINTFAARAFTPRVLNWMHACWGIGATIGPLVMTFAIASRVGWRGGYVVVAVAIALLMIVFFATRAGWTLPGNAQAAVDADGIQIKPAGLIEAIRHRPVQLHVAFFLCYCCIEMGAGNWLFAMLSEQRGMAIPTAGSLVGAYWASLTVGRIAFGQLAHHLGGVTILRLGLIGAILGSGLLLPGLPRVALFIGPLLLGFSLAPLFPTMVALTPGRVGDRFAAQSVALQISAAGIGIAIGSALIGLLAAPFGLNVVPFVLLAAGLLLVALHELIDARGSAVTTSRSASATAAPVN